MSQPNNIAAAATPTQSQWALVCLLYGVLVVLLALAAALVTVVHSTGTQFIIAALLACVGDWLLFRACRHGGPVVRGLSVLAMLPTVYVWMDFVGRIPYLIRQAFAAS